MLAWRLDGVLVLIRTEIGSTCTPTRSKASECARPPCTWPRSARATGRCGSAWSSRAGTGAAPRSVRPRRALLAADGTICGGAGMSDGTEQNTAVDFTQDSSGIEKLLGDPLDRDNPLGFEAVPAADERREMLPAGEWLLDEHGLNADFVPASLGGRFAQADRLARPLRPVFRRDCTLGWPTCRLPARCSPTPTWTCWSPAASPPSRSACCTSCLSRASCSPRRPSTWCPRWWPTTLGTLLGARSNLRSGPYGIFQKNSRDTQLLTFGHANGTPGDDRPASAPARPQALERAHTGARAVVPPRPAARAPGLLCAADQQPWAGRSRVRLRPLPRRAAGRAGHRPAVRAVRRGAAAPAPTGCRTAAQGPDGGGRAEGVAAGRTVHPAARRRGLRRCEAPQPRPARPRPPTTRAGSWRP
jgi:hypothetical protein